jgi:hypothetical protein
MKTIHFVLLSFVIIGCVPPPSDVILLPDKSQFVPYNFKYNLPEKKANADFTLAIMSPSFDFLGNMVSLNSPLSPSYSEWLFKKQMSDDAQEYVNKLVVTYLSALQTDLEKVLVATGNRTIGPFSDKEKLTYPQRQQSDFVFEPKLKIFVSEELTNVVVPYREEVQIGVAPKKKKSTPNPDNGDDYASYIEKQRQIHPGQATGNISIVAQLDIYLYEPVTWEKMWIKSISIPVTKKQYTYKWNDDNGKRIYGEDTRPTILSEVLTSSYKEILDEFVKYFDPNELKAIDLKGKEIREKKRF